MSDSSTSTTTPTANPVSPADKGVRRSPALLDRLPPRRGGQRGIGRLFGERLHPAGVLGGMVAIYLAVIGRLVWAQQSNFGTFGFDMGIYDQSIWLLSRFKDPFSTIRGLEYFGFHVNVVAFLLVPVYWLGGGPHALYAVETAFLAAGAVPIWLLATDRLEDEWLALGPAGAFLLFPSLEWVNWWHFHPEALSITPLLFAWWLASRRRWLWCAVAVAVALSTKEDVALAVAFMGIAVALRFDWRRGAAMVGAGLAWFLACTKVVIPHFDGGQAAFYADFFPTLGRSLPQVVATIVRHPTRLIRLVAKSDRHTYYVQMLAPVALLPVLGGWSALLVGLPQFVVNTSSSVGYTHDIKFHYSSLVIVAVWLGTVEALGARGRTAAGRRFLVGAVVAASLAANVAWSPSPISVHFHNGEWARPSATASAQSHAVRAVARSAGVTASYSIVTHLTHRVHIYEWPNPFVTANWGIADRHPDPVSNVDTLVLDTNLAKEPAGLLASLIGPGGPFKITFTEGTVIVAQRVAQPGGVGSPSR